MFELHPRLQNDCLELGRFPLCRLLLMNESRYPWFVLVPERADLTEIYQLSDMDQQLFWRESSRLAQSLAVTYQADKLNIASIGNLVPQLHVHHIVRYRNDAAWPGPVWGRFEPMPYQDDQRNELIARIKCMSVENLVWTI